MDGREIQQSFPPFMVAQAYLPPSRPLMPAEDKEAEAAINRARPDMLWVGLGTRHAAVQESSVPAPSAKPESNVRMCEIASCALCSEAARERFRLGHTRVYQCSEPECRLQFAEPQLGDEALDASYRRLYYPAGAGEQAVLENTPRGVIVQVLRHILRRVDRGSGMRLLDYGCGRGELSEIAMEFGFAPVGIEQDLEARQEIEHEALFPVYPSLECLKKQEGQGRFDFIILWQVIEHLRRPWDDLTRLRGLLAENGWLLAATPNAGGLKARMLGPRWENYWNPTHF